MGFRIFFYSDNSNQDGKGEKESFDDFSLLKRFPCFYYKSPSAAQVWTNCPTSRTGNNSLRHATVHYIQITIHGHPIHIFGNWTWLWFFPPQALFPSVLGALHPPPCVAIASPALSAPTFWAESQSQSQSQSIASRESTSHFLFSK
jgi:hypothetical protein